MNEHDRQVAEMAWDACVASMKYENGEPVEVVVSINPYRSRLPHSSLLGGG